MRIRHLRINGIRNPIGYDFEKAALTFHVEEVSEDVSAVFTAEVSTDKDFTQIVYSAYADPLAETGLEFRREACTRYYVRVKALINEEKTVFSDEEAFFETGMMGQTFQAEWITTSEDIANHPVFFHEFTSEKKPFAARLYICGLGLYEAYLNQEKISDTYLAPGLWDYEDEYEYQTYDITGQIHEGVNRIEVLLGNGWYKGRFGLDGTDNVYGDRFLLIAEIHLSDADGNKRIIATGKDWQYRSSAIRESSIYDGEVIDESAIPGGVYPAAVTEIDRPLCAKKGIALRQCGEFNVAEVIRTEADETVLDFGQNIAGFVQFTGRLKEGQTILLEYGEVLQKGCFCNENYRSAKARFEYTTGNTAHTVRPHFTYYGFRYVRVNGINEINPADFVAVQIASDVERTGAFECSNPLVNRLYQNAFYSQMDNFVEIPTDCPQRDERLGWTGDAQMFAPTACFNADCCAFYERFLLHLHHYQLKHDGAIPNYFPMQGFLGGSCQIWGDAVVFICDALKRYYANAHFYETGYRMMRMWIDYCLKHMVNDQYMIKGHMQFGDWLALDGVTEQSMRGGTDDDYVASMYFCESLKKTIAYGEDLGIDQSDLRTIREQLKESILNEYFSNTGRLCVDTQTGYLLALRFGIYRNKDEIIKGLRKRFEKDAYRIRCGFAGAPNLVQILAENGLEREALHFLLNEEYPGWLNEVKLGATTIWERWNSILADGSLSGSGMNSLNHYAYGNVCEFLYTGLAGIRPLKDGFREVQIQPLISGYFSSVNCEYRSAAGKYIAAWKTEENGTVHVHLEIPYACKAKVILPQCDETVLGGGSYDFEIHPEHNVRMVYDGDSFICDLSANALIRDEMLKRIPQLYYMSISDVESRHLTLNRIMEMPFLGLDLSIIDSMRAFVKTVPFEKQ